MRKYLIILFFMIACLSLYAEDKALLFPVPQIPFNPKTYDCPLIWNNPLTIDGQLSEKVWQQAQWTDSFVDIVSESMPKPRFLTKAKMLWDEKYLYIGAEMEETDLWATIKDRDAVIFHDNDFEVFIDTDSDTHNYYELEINALNTVWDLMLLKPYRDGDKVAVDSWNIDGLKTAVYLNGTLNNPNDKDRGWSVEIAIPWESICMDTNYLRYHDYKQLRVNFSRVEWKHDVVNGQYVKQNDSKGNPLPEDNWVWSPQGLVAMHYPEMWGFLNLKHHPDAVMDPVTERIDYQVIWTLRRIYYLEKEYYLQNGSYASKVVKETSFLASKSWKSPRIEVKPKSYIASIKARDGYCTWFINNEGKTWTVTKK